MSGLPSPSPWAGARRSGAAPLVALLRALGITLLSYLAAAGIFELIQMLIHIPHGGLWEEALKLPTSFSMMIVAMVIFLVPLFRSDSGSALRQFSMLASSFFVVYAVLSTAHIGQPDVPLVLIARYAVDPLRSVILR